MQTFGLLADLVASFLEFVLLLWQELWALHKLVGCVHLLD